MSDEPVKRAAERNPGVQLYFKGKGEHVMAIAKNPETKLEVSQPLTKAASQDPAQMEKFLNRLAAKVASKSKPNGTKTRKQQRKKG